MCYCSFVIVKQVDVKTDGLTQRKIIVVIFIVCIHKQTDLEHDRIRNGEVINHVWNGMFGFSKRQAGNLSDL